MSFFLGVDMSCYTTSCAVCDESGGIIYDRRLPLRVPEGKKGLRQQEMVFLHIKQIRDIFPEGYSFAAVGGSTRPRDIEGSYMPVFSACESFSRVAARAAGAEFYPLTHQHGHIMAALIGKSMPDSFIALHVSGGTTDAVSVEMRDGIITGIEQIGGTADIAAGQFIDRIGVMLGLPFPCGPKVEELAKNGTPVKLRADVRGTEISFSGPESAVRRMIEKGMSCEDAAATVQECIAEVLTKMILNCVDMTGKKDILLSGGVMSNRKITETIKAGTGAEVSERRYASDNACGLAVLARNIFLNKPKGE